MSKEFWGRDPKYFEIKNMICHRISKVVTTNEQCGGGGCESKEVIDGWSCHQTSWF